MTENVTDEKFVAMTRDQRTATAELLGSLSETEWTHPTLCDGWTVEHLAAHLSMPFRIGLPRLMMAMISARGDFDRAADRLARRDIERMTRVQLVEVLHANVSTKWKVPGGDLADSFCHDVIHGLDLTEGLGRPHTATPEQLLTTLNVIKTKNRMEHFGVDLRGHTAVASDMDFRIGKGLEITLPAGRLVLLLTGRESVEQHLKRAE
ncbi:maleylpyruvate isomerase family mycothiol-dependent enzyme [Rhodococcus sp. NPDC057297]|uniref:maleylpyruvate isomerase family mycothiol-dependent enzyme n=1 Tax=Rhodococcus sp. NPDC057297 TaxID=3346090 RepID=UPI0036374A5B